MADYAAVPVQPIAFALLTINAAGNPVITGRGFSSAARASVTGDFLLTFDEGVGVADIGSGNVTTVNGQDVPGFGYPDGQIGPNGMDPNFGRVSVTMRAGTTAPGTTTISSRIVTWVVTPGSGALQLQITLRNTANAVTDPMGAGVANADGGGVEIMVWNGNAGPDAAAVQLVGPLFQVAMQFP
jgi:hypothetical protein